MNVDMDAVRSVVATQSERTDAFGLRHGFHAKANEAAAAGDHQLERTMRLLSEVFSMMDRDSAQQPFAPLATYADGSTTLLPEHLVEDDLKLLEVLLEASDRPAYVARIADVLWLRRRDPAFARRAILAYLGVVQIENLQSWVPYRNALRRAAQLACQLGRKAAERTLVRERIKELLRHAEQVCNSQGMGYWPAALAEILIENRLLPSEEWTWLGELGERIAGTFPITPGCDGPRKYYQLAAECYTLAKQPDRSERMRLAIAEHWQAEGRVFREAGASPLLVAHRLTGAIDAYKKTRTGQEEAKRLSVELKQAQRAAMGDLRPISAQMDVSPFIQATREEMEGKSGAEAILSLIRLHGVVSFETTTQAAERSLREHPLQAMFQMGVLTPEGNVAAVVPGSTDDDPARLQAAVIQQYNFRQSLAGAIVLQEGRRILLENTDISWRMAVQDLIEIHPLVADSRKLLFTRALMSGFDGDTVAAIHLMTPQIEFLVREWLHREG